MLLLRIHRLISASVLVSALFNLSACANGPEGKSQEKPNFVIIFTDDQGYGDLGCYGSSTIETPNIDRMAKEGRKFSNFMVASSVCTPSRAALLTGSYPKRTGMTRVLFPGSKTGLHPDEYTIADHLKAQGYATACIGKWHLGHHPETLPRQNGFDSYYGIPYSNDMNHPDNEGKPKTGPDGMDLLWAEPDSTLTKWRTPLIENETIIELPVDQRTITRRYTDRAIDFIKTNKEKPFFLYLPHSMPHIPLYVPDDFYDPDPKKAYIRVIEHIDAEVGRLMETIRDLDLEKNTIVVFTSDNGPWLSYKHHGGSAGPLRDGKMTTFEGGQRVPCVMWAPGRIPAGTACDQLVSTLDILPTIAVLTDTQLPGDRIIDGLDVSSLLTDNEPISPRNEFLYYAAWSGEVEGIRQNEWKLLVKQARRKKGAPAAAEPEVLLFNLSKDIGEQNNLAEQHPELVTTLAARMHELDAEIEANRRSPWVKGE